MADARQYLRNRRIIPFVFLGIPAFLFFPLNTVHFQRTENRYFCRSCLQY